MSFIIYQTGPLFSQAERDFHAMLKLELEKAGHAIAWPGELLTPASILGAGHGAKKLIFETRRKALNGCNCVVALLDGAQVDDGTAWEIGYAYAKGLPIYGLRTDSRCSGDTRYNQISSVIEGSLARFAATIPELLELLAMDDDISMVVTEVGKRGF